MSATSDLTTPTTTLPSVNEELMDYAGKYVSSYATGDIEMNRQNMLRCLQEYNCRDVVVAATDESELAISFVEASSKAHVDVVQSFLDNGMNVDVKGSLGCTALMRASGNGKEECVRLLLDRNANVDVQRNDAWTALMYASVNSNIKVVEMLLEKNADMNVQNKNGWTALMRASRNNKKETVQLLLNYGADTDLKNEDGRTAFDLASNKEIKELLLNHVNNSYVLK